MAEEQKIASLADLEENRTTSGKIVTLPDATKKKGEDVNIAVRAIEPIEFVKALNFPIDEVNALIHSEQDEGTFAHNFEEHVKTLGYDDLIECGQCVIELGTIEPVIEPGTARKFFSDSDIMFAFKAIRDLTMPGRSAEEAASFRGDGELGSD